MLPLMDVTYRITTDANGAWNLPYSVNYTKNIIVSINWTGNDTYTVFVNTNNFNVGKINVLLTWILKKIRIVFFDVVVKIIDKFGNSVSNHVINIDLNVNT